MTAATALLVIPPLTQLNTPYPATAYLTGLLRSRGYAVAQADVGIEMVLALFSRDGLSRLFERLRAMSDLPGEAAQMLALERAYVDSIDAVIAFLQGRDPTLASRICQGGFLPQGPRFATASERTLARTFHATDQAKHWATLYLEDLADLARATVAPQFALSRYAEHLGASATSFDPIARALAEPPSLTDELMLDAFWAHVHAVTPTVVGVTVPFPGNLYGAFRLAQSLKTRRPDIKIVLGGGYATTELRRLAEPRVFDYVDFVTLDDGERPLLCLLEYLSGQRAETALCRTFARPKNRVLFQNGATEPDIGMADCGTPTYDGLPLDRYLSILDTLNPMHRLWSDGHWNKLTVAHGCYWKQCTFCDIGLDYIGRYEATPSDILTDRIETLVAETGRRGFHFVDEAAPPSGLKNLALRLLERGVTISWWGNIRFEPAFTPDICRLLAASGCIAVSAGLETASDRLLAAMKKGITLNQTARVSAAFRQAGIMVHAYLMYGFPGETVDETVESLERVRQLFAQGLIQSAFWHKFVATAHSPVGLDPESHGILITGPRFAGFAENDLTHEDRQGRTPDWIGVGLRRALLNFIEGVGLPADVRSWFDHPVKKPKVPRDWAARALATPSLGDDPTVDRKFVWTGGTPTIEPTQSTRRVVILPGRTEDTELRLDSAKAAWLAELIRQATPIHGKGGKGYPSLKEARASYPLGGPAFDVLLQSAVWKKTRSAGLLLI